MKLKHTTITAAAIISATALQSCDYFLPGNYELVQEIEYSSNYTGDKLVLNGRISDGHGVYAEVMHSVRVDKKNESDTVADATVYLIEDGETIATLHKNTERRLTLNIAERFMYYLLPGEVDIKEGHQYSMRVESTTRGTAESAPSIMPSHVDIDSVWVASRSYWRSQYRSFGLAYHNAKVGSYIEPFMRSYRYDACHTKHYIRYSSLIEITDDKGYVTVDKSGYNEYCDSVSVEALTLSDDFESYLESVYTYSESSDDEAYEYPLPVTENVSGGYGYVGTYSVSAQTIIADEANSTIGDDDYDYDSSITIDNYINFDLWWQWRN